MSRILCLSTLSYLAASSGTSSTGNWNPDTELIAHTLLDLGRNLHVSSFCPDVMSLLPPKKGRLTRLTTSLTSLKPRIAGFSKSFMFFYIYSFNCVMFPYKAASVLSDASTTPYSSCYCPCSRTGKTVSVAQRTSWWKPTCSFIDTLGDELDRLSYGLRSYFSNSARGGGKGVGLDIQKWSFHNVPQKDASDLTCRNPECLNWYR